MVYIAVKEDERGGMSADSMEQEREGRDAGSGGRGGVADGREAEAAGSMRRRWRESSH